MEFKFRSNNSDHKQLPSPFVPQPLNSDSSDDHLYRDIGSSGYNDPSHFGCSSFGLVNEYYSHPTDLEEAIQLDMGNEGIRAGTIIEEIMRGHIEAKVRRELMLEKYMALQGGVGDPGFFSLEPQSTMMTNYPNQFLDPMLHYNVDAGFPGENVGRSLQEKIAMPATSKSENWGLESALVMSDEPRNSEVKSKLETEGSLSLQEWLVMPATNESENWGLESALVMSDEPRVSEVKSESETNKDEDKITLKVMSGEPRISEVTSESKTNKDEGIITFMGKKEVDVSGVKRKTMIEKTINSNESLSAGGNTANKKMKNDWTCKICDVTATCEQNLQAHLQGKKHKAKEAVQAKKGKSFNIGWSIHPARAKSTSPELDLPPAEDAKIIPSNEALVEITNDEDNSFKFWSIPPANNTNSKVDSTHAEDAMTINNPLLNKEEQFASKENNEAPVEITTNNAAPSDQSNSFKLWCEMCLVGAQSVGVMEAHRAGKKHLAHLGRRL